MDENALFAFGTVLAALGGILERTGVCTTMELADALGGVGLMTCNAGEQYDRRGRYILEWAHMVKAAAEAAGSSNLN